MNQDFLKKNANTISALLFFLTAGISFYLLWPAIYWSKGPPTDGRKWGLICVAEAAKEYYAQHGVAPNTLDDLVGMRFTVELRDGATFETEFRPSEELPYCLVPDAFASHDETSIIVYGTEPDRDGRYIVMIINGDVDFVGENELPAQKAQNGK